MRAKALSLLLISAVMAGCGLSDREQRMLVEISDLQAALQTSDAKVKELELIRASIESKALGGAKELAVSYRDIRALVETEELGSFEFETTQTEPTVITMGKSDKIHALIRTDGTDAGPVTVTVMTFMGKESGAKEASNNTDLQLSFAQLLCKDHAEQVAEIHNSAIKLGKQSQGRRVVQDVGDLVVTGGFDQKLGMTSISYQLRKTGPGGGI